MATTNSIHEYDDSRNSEQLPEACENAGDAASVDETIPDSLEAHSTNGESDQATAATNTSNVVHSPDYSDFVLPQLKSEGSRKRLTAALSYAKRGWRVIPDYGLVEGICSCSKGNACRSTGKHPRINQWEKGATTDPKTPVVWWTTWPDTNVGIATGPGSNLLVIDIDPGNGGDETFRQLEKQYGALPTTVRVRTGSGGEHIYFQHPGISITSAAHALGKGVDIRADGAQVVAPPSSHVSGNEYTWQPGCSPDEVAVADCPKAWLDLILGRQYSKKQASHSPKTTSIQPTQESRIDDKELVRMATNAANREKFSAFWRGDNLGLPSNSEADLALCSLLAFWTAKDEQQMHRLFRLSGRMRDKWDEIHDSDGLTYGEMTIQTAISSCRETYSCTPAEVSVNESELERARELVDRLAAEKPDELYRMAIESESIAFLALLREHDAAEFEQALLKFQSAGLKANNAKRLKSITWARMQKHKQQKKRARAEAKQRPGDNSRAAKVRDELPDAPVPPDTIVPGCWCVTPAGIARLNFGEGGEAKEIIAPGPLVISRRMIDVVTKRVRVEIAFLRDGKWKTTVVNRQVISSTREIVGLADDDVPVNSVNASDIVEYLADFEAANFNKLPVDHVSSQFGWIEDGFLLGSEFITAGESSPKSPSGHSHSMTLVNRRVTFVGEDSGDKQRAAGLRCEGTFDEWKSAVHPAAKYPRVMLALYTSFVPPLLEILEATNFVIDISGQSSAGKTTTLRLAASVWGDPDERRPGALLQTWDATEVFIERTAAVCSGLPVLVDDTRQVRKPEIIEGILYRIASGQGRGRGSIKGTQTTRTFRTVLLISGEEPATGFARAGGSHARTITVWGMPFGKTDQKTANVVNQINAGVKANFGHGGEAFIRFLLDRREKWPILRRVFRQQILPRYIAKAASDPVIGRLSEYLAAIDFAGRLAHAALHLPWRYSNPLDKLWATLVAGGDQVDTAAAAMRHVRSWAFAHESEFLGRGQSGSGSLTKKHPPSAGWAGFWYDKIRIPNTPAEIGFYPHRLKEILKAGDYQPDATLRAWRDRGWLNTAKGEKRLTKKMRIENESVWVHAIRQKAFDEV